MLYSPLTSTNGAKLLASKGPPRKRDIEDLSSSLLDPPILTPHALPMFRDGEVSSGIAGTKRKRDRERADPRKSRRPELPVNGPGKGGRVGASATQHVVRHLVRDTTRDEDVSDFDFHCLPLFLTAFHSRARRCSSMPTLQRATRNGLAVSTCVCRERLD